MCFQHRYKDIFTNMIVVDYEKGNQTYNDLHEKLLHL